MRTFVPRLLLSGGLLAAATGGALGATESTLPSLTFEPRCELAGAFISMQQRDEQLGSAAARRCIEDESEARNWLTKEWNGLDPALKRECLDHVTTTRKGLEYSWIKQCIVNRLAS